MSSRTVISLVTVAILTFAASCSNKAADPTGLRPKMTKDEVIATLGQPAEIKSAGKNKEIYIYRTQTELTHVFLIDGRIKSIEHVQRPPPRIAR